MRRIWFALLLAGCWAAPPPPAIGPELTGCRAGAYGALGEHECRTDADCVLCGCERIESREHLMLTNAACPQRRCEVEAHCCLGRCTRTLGPPPL